MSRQRLYTAVTNPYDEPQDNRSRIQAQRQLLQAVMQAELSARQRESFWRHVGQGESQKEIAHDWGVHPSVVCRHIAKARRRLMQISDYMTSAIRDRESCEDC